MTTKFSIEIVFRQVQMCAKFYCPSSTVTLFSGGVESTPHPHVLVSQKSPTEIWLMAAAVSNSEEPRNQADDG